MTKKYCHMINTDEQILYKAIIKAEKNGYKGHMQYLPIHLSKKFSKTQFKKLLARIWYAHAFEIIFSHEFAKAIFGIKEGPTTVNDNGVKTFQQYEMDLAMMVLEKEPIKYLEKFI